jgi:hypothetical protein
MNSTDPSYKKQLYRNLLIVAITIIVTAIAMLLKPWVARKARWVMMTTQERTEDTSSNLLKPQDSVQLSSGKVSQSDFESDYTAANWYAEYRSNKVAFDKNIKTVS